MISPSNLKIYEWPATSARYIWEGNSPKTETSLDFATVMLESAFIFAEDFCKFLSIEIVLGYAENMSENVAQYSVTDLPETLKFHILEKTSLPSGTTLTKIHTPLNHKQVNNITYDSAKIWLYNLLQENDVQGMTIGVLEMRVETLQIALPEEITKKGENTLEIVDTQGNFIHYPVEQIEGEAWVSGPCVNKASTAPLDIRVTHYYGEMQLDLTIYWSLWSEPEAAGQKQIQHAQAQLEKFGWKSL